MPDVVNVKLTVASRIFVAAVEVTFCFVYLTLDKGDGCCVGGFAEALR